MIKDIKFHKVEDLAIAIVPRIAQDVQEEELWDTYIINFKEDVLEGVFISSKGYGKIDGEKRETTTLRHFFEAIGPKQAVLIEPIQTKLFDMTNEYWVSFKYQNYMYDKKYVFVRGSITPEHFTTIPLIEKKGVMIR